MEGEAAHHLGRVLRVQIGQRYELSDGERVWLGEIASVGRDRVQFTLVEELPARQQTLDITLLLSVVKFDMFEWAIEKATELGVTTIVPLSAARSEKALLTSSVKRAERWRKILLESSQQSRRVRLPVLAELTAPDLAFASHRDGLRIMLSERPDAPSIRKVLEGQRNAKATLAIGPEGGWTDAEVQASRKQGFLDASLGRLILRTETAVAAALASLNYALGGD
jgi:16S rRNA (uracil1498-N3)-methyltransferase